MENIIQKQSVLAETLGSCRTYNLLLILKHQKKHIAVFQPNNCIYEVYFQLD